MMSCPIPSGTSVDGGAGDSGHADQELSVPQQVAQMRRFAAEHGLAMVRIFKDEARPGSTTVGREGFEALIAATRHPMREASALLLWSYSRFARDFNDAAFFKADLRRLGWQIHSISDAVPAGDFAPILEANIDWKNQRFLKDLGADVKRGLHRMASQGYAPGGFPPRGYKAEAVEIGKRRDGKPRIVTRWVEDGGLGPLARLAWKMRAKGASYGEVQEATGLYKTKSCWTAFFGNRTYLGILKCGDEEFPESIPALVDQATFDAVQAMKRKRTQASSGMPDSGGSVASPDDCSGHHAGLWSFGRLVDTANEDLTTGPTVATMNLHCRGSLIRDPWSEPLRSLHSSLRPSAAVCAVARLLQKPSVFITGRHRPACCNLSAALLIDLGEIGLELSPGDARRSRAQHHLSTYLALRPGALLLGTRSLSDLPVPNPESENESNPERDLPG